MVAGFRCGCSWNTTSTCTDFGSAGILPAERRHPAGFTETFRGGPLPASFLFSQNILPPPPSGRGVGGGVSADSKEKKCLRRRGQLSTSKGEAKVIFPAH